ncbi:hypothetical protein GCM10010207_43790 [Streptomyces atratus]|uniref:hypothetical protein n=1 Tax=Streptomyces atratus TaxID=1893 RepID=UPI0016701B34|nr:hypothetical protein [Streptomyces atratus]GGT38815.1 hypothetical protein GCM10010207_43790 [Streptomyces atratus]
MPASAMTRSNVQEILLDTVPETAEPIRLLAQEDADGEVLLFPFLREGFADPLVMPALRLPSAHEDLLRRCFACVDLGLRSTDTTLNDAFWFQVLELLLDAAYPFMTDETRDYVLEKLTDFGVPLTPHWSAWAGSH